MGSILNPEDAFDCDGGSFIRVRVLIDIMKPLCRGRLITLEDGTEHWVSFKYERLTNLCYWCGCLTHDDRDCEVWIDSEGSLKLEDQQLGPWLRALPFVASRKKVVSVLGFFAKKSMGKTAQPTSNPPSQPQTAAQQVSTFQAAPPSLSVNAMSEILGNKFCNGLKSPKIAKKSKSDIPPNHFIPINFKELICDIDKDIQRYDRVAPASQILNEVSTASTLDDNFKPGHQSGSAHESPNN